jgi:hypothetical protein
MDLRGTWLAAALLAASLTPAGATAEAVALAVEIEGATDPAIEPFSEIDSGSSLDLGKATRIEFMHYTSCQTVIVVGGRITFTEQQFLVKGGEIVDVKRAKCPEVASAKGGNLGGVLLRSGGGAMKLLPEPRFAFVGAGRGAFDRLRVVKGEAVVLEARIDGHQFAWPETALPLAPGEGYALELLRRDGGEATRIDFEVKASRGKAPMTVVRLD